MTTVEEEVRKYVEIGDSLEPKLRVEGSVALARLMEEQSLRETARRLKCSPTYLSNIKNGKQVVSPRTYLRMVELLQKQQETDACNPS